MKGALLLVFALFAFTVLLRPVSAGAVECSICKFLVGEAEKYVEQNATESDIISELNKTCKIMGDQKFITDCQDLVATYAPKIIQMLVNKEDPTQICSDLTLCANSTIAVVSEKLTGAIECAICKFLVGEAEKYVAQNSTVQDIESELDKACELFKGNLEADCKTIVTTYTPQIVQALENKEDPSQICADITLCSNSTLCQQKLQGDMECGACTFIVGLTEKYVEQNKTEAEIVAEVSKACDLLHDKAWVTTCQGAITTYGSQIIGLVLNKEPADVICNQIGMCGNSTAKVSIKVNDAPVVAAKPSIVAIKINSPADKLECYLCQFLVNQTEQFVAENKTEGDIVDELNKICNDLPFGNKECTAMITEYGDLIISYLVNEQPASVVCTEIKLCSSSNNFSINGSKKLVQ